MHEPWSVPVPEGYLELPYPHDRHRILRFESGLALDGPMRRLSRVSGAVDRALALRLARLRSSRGYLTLGYARFGDYARERLGIAERTAFDLARLGSALKRLPLLDRALARGRLTWTAALQVARVSGTDDETDWVACATSLSVRALKQQVYQTLAERQGAARSDAHENDELAAAAAVKQKATGGSDDDDDQPERLGQVRMQVPAKTACSWHAALDLCRQIAGFELVESEAAEYVLADFISGGVPLPDDLPPCRPGRAPVRFEGRDGLHPAQPPRLLPPVARELGSHLLLADLSRDIDELLRLVEAAPATSGPFELDEAMRRLVTQRAGVDLDLARLLRNFRSLDLAAHLGYASFGEYVEARLGISARRARFLVQLDRNLCVCPGITRAVRDGRIGTVAALRVARVARSDTTEIWLERAERIPVVQLRREVEWAERNARLTRFRRPMLPPTGGRLVTALDELTDELLGQRKPFAEESAIESVGLAVAEPDRGYPESRQTFALSGGHDAWVRRMFDGPSPEVEVVFWLPESAASLWTEARRQISHLSGEGFVPDRVVLHWIALDFLATHLPLWLEALALDDPIAVRERYRCAIPGCTVYGGSGHHIKFRAHGGSDDPWNLSFLCYSHHIEGLHRGHIRVRGRAPDRLTVELGIKPAGSALETFVNGERVLPIGLVPAGSPTPAPLSCRPSEEASPCVSAYSAFR